MTRWGSIQPRCAVATPNLEVVQMPHGVGIGGDREVHAVAGGPLGELVR